MSKRRGMGLTKKAIATVKPNSTRPAFENPEEGHKYRGKAREDIIQMHQEAEKLLGRLSNELGELRKELRTYKDDI